MAHLLAREQFSREALEIGLHAGDGALAGELARRVLTDYAYLPDPVVSFNDWLRNLRDRRLRRAMEETTTRIQEAEAAGNDAAKQAELKVLKSHRIASMQIGAHLWQDKKK